MNKKRFLNFFFSGEGDLNEMYAILIQQYCDRHPI